MSDAPLPVPLGWFQIGWPDDIAVGQTRPLFYFGRHLVLWRDEDRVAHLNDAFCPHLGAHLGHGGSVHGTDLQCPFHGWRFDADGNNSDIPYSERTNKKCRLGAYPVIERNGLLMAWYHPEGLELQWDIPTVPELDDPEWTDAVTHEFIVASPWQEMAENGADSAHFGFVHGQDTVPEIDRYDTDGPRAFMASTQRWPTPNGSVDAFVEAESHGPGFSIVRMTGVIDALSIGCNTPVAADRCHLRFTNLVKRLDREDLTTLVGDTFIRLLMEQVGEDVIIWENKIYVERPALADTDGPIMAFRSWAEQFYVPAPTTSQ